MKVEQPKGKLGIFDGINESKKQLNAQIDATCKRIEDGSGPKEGTAGGFGLGKQEIPKEKTQVIPMIVKSEEKSPIIQGLQKQHEDYMKSLEVIDVSNGMYKTK